MFLAILLNRRHQNAVRINTGISRVFGSDYRAVAAVIRIPDKGEVVVNHHFKILALELCVSNRNPVFVSGAVVDVVAGHPEVSGGIHMQMKTYPNGRLSHFKEFFLGVQGAVAQLGWPECQKYCASSRTHYAGTNTRRHSPAF